MKSLLVKLPDDIYTQLRTKSLKEKTPMREIVISALSVYMFKQPQKEEKKADKNAGKMPLGQKVVGLFVERKGDMLFKP